MSGEEKRTKVSVNNGQLHLQPPQRVVHARHLDQKIEPGSLHAPLMVAVQAVVADGSEAGHCFGTGGLRAPPVVANGSKAGHCFH